MKIVKDDIRLCEDCMFYAVNGDLPSDSTPKRDNLIVSGVRSFGIHLSTDLRDAEDSSRSEFSTRPCDSCNRSIGGSRYCFVVLGEDNVRV